MAGGWMQAQVCRRMLCGAGRGTEPFRDFRDLGFWDTRSARCVVIATAYGCFLLDTGSV